MAHALQRILRPNVLIPVFLVVAAIVLLFTFGNPARILAEMESFNRIDLIWVFLLMIIYEGIRFLQWWYLLRHEGIRVSLQAQIFSFAGGEATRFMPIGNYFENYLLTAAEGVDFGFSSAVTTMIILLEVAVSLSGLVVLGLGGWWWIRPLILAGVALAAAVVWLFYRFHHSLDAPAWVCRSKRARKAWESIANELRQFTFGVKKLLRWRTLLVSYLLAAAYLVTAGGMLYIILAGIGWGSSSFGEILAVYFFSLAFSLIFPLPVDIGVTELSGVGAFLVIGVDRNIAISAMLINRVLTLGFSIVIGIAVSVLFHDEFRRALHARGAKPAGRPAPANDSASSASRSALTSASDATASSPHPLEPSRLVGRSSHVGPTPRWRPLRSPVDPADTSSPAANEGHAHLPTH